jgi:hypothetical protein
MILSQRGSCSPRSLGRRRGEARVRVIVIGVRVIGVGVIVFGVGVVLASSSRSSFLELHGGLSSEDL